VLPPTLQALRGDRRPPAPHESRRGRRGRALPLNGREGDPPSRANWFSPLPESPHTTWPLVLLISFRTENPALECKHANCDGEPGARHWVPGSRTPPTHTAGPPGCPGPVLILIPATFEFVHADFLPETPEPAPTPSRGSYRGPAPSPPPHRALAPNRLEAQGW